VNQDLEIIINSINN